MNVTADPLLRRTWPQRIFILLGLALAVLSAFFAWRIFTLREALADVPRIRTPFGVLAEEVDDGGPVNLLIIGTDSAEGLAADDAVNAGRGAITAEPPRADVMLLLRLDPRTGKASVLSIPRDLYVDVTGFQEMKIGEALQLGGLENGSTTVVRTLQDQFDIEIHDFVIIDFLGFRELVDALDGIPVWFPRSATDVGANFIVKVPEGGACVVLDGEQALGYVRGRKYQEEVAPGEWKTTQGSDLLRIRRQQDFLILAIQRAIDKGARSLIFQNTLINAAAKALTLDDRMSPQDLKDLGASFSDFEPAELRRLTFDGFLYDDVIRSGGNEVQALRLSEIPTGILDVFRGYDDLNPSAVEVEVIETRALDEAEDVTVMDHLEGKGFQPTLVGDEAEIDKTVISFHPDQRAAAELLARFLTEIPEFDVDDSLDADGPIVLKVGSDYDGFMLFPRQSSEDFADALEEAAPTTTADPDAATTTEGPPAVDGTGTSVATTTTSPPIQGQPPEGVDCG